MAHWKIIHILGQSNIDGRNLYSNTPADLLAQGKAWIDWITGRVMPSNIQVAWRSDEGEITFNDYNLAEFGDDRIGNNWARDNVEGSTPFNCFSYVHVAIAKIAVMNPSDNYLICQVTSGGSRLRATGILNVNGSWNTDYEAIPEGTPRLTEAWEIKRQDLLAYLDSIEDTYEEVMAFWHQGENDATTPLDYVTDETNLFALIRAGNANMPIYSRTIPRRSSGYGPIVDDAKKAVAAANPLNKLFNISNLNFFQDPVHMDHRTQILNGEDLADWHLGIETVVTSERKVGPIRTSIDYAQRFIDAAELEGTHVTAIQNLVAGLKIIGINRFKPAIYPVIGGTAVKHALNLFNPDLYPLSFTGCTHDAGGIQGNGISTRITTIFSTQTNGVIPTRWRASNNFGLDIYSVTEELDLNSADAYIPVNGTQFRLRFFINSTEASPFTNGQRLDNSGGSPALTLRNNTNTLPPVNALGLWSWQIGGGNAELVRNGSIYRTVAYNESPLGNSSVNFGTDGANRFSAKKYAFLVPARERFDASQLTDYYQLIQEYQTALGRNA